jgi:hypothetical protein
LQIQRERRKNGSQRKCNLLYIRWIANPAGAKKEWLAAEMQSAVYPLDYKSSGSKERTARGGFAIRRTSAKFHVWRSTKIQQRRFNGQ